MKKKRLIIVIVIFVLLVALGLYFLLRDNTKYKIVTHKIDNNSPDLTLKVYKDDEESEIEKIYYLDDVLLHAHWYGLSCNLHYYIGD